MAASDPTITVNFQSELPGGCRIIAGIMTMTNTYVTSGTNNEMVLSSYFLSSSSPMVVFTGATTGYMPVHNNGTAAAGKVLLYEAGADGAGLDEFANAGDASGLNAMFIAMGQTP